MPLLEIEIVGEPEREEGLAQRLADAAASVFGSAPQGTWVRLRALPLDWYAENGGSEGVLPVFVHVIERVAPEKSALEERVAKLAAVVAQATGRPSDNVHVIYEPPGAGRVAFGGRIVW